MERLKWIEIDLGAIRRNLAWARGRLSPGVRLMAVVKADAYGHGASRVAALAEEAGADCLGVLTAEEGLELRDSGIRTRIVLLSPPLPSQAGLVRRARLEATVDSEALAAALARAGGRPAAVHLDVDLGLRRWGAPPARAGALAARIRKDGRLRLAGISTHVDYVPGKNSIEAEEKLQRFQRLAAAAARGGALERHAANTSILLDFPQWQLDMVRVGNLLYGINPTKSPAPLANPWRFQARVVALRRIGRGEAVGYASEYIAPRPMTVATVPVGYSDGLTMEPAERLIGLGSQKSYWGMIGVRQAPFVGRCAIAHALLDVTGIPGVRIGTAVTLPIRRTAASSRIPRVYISG